ncbi:MAG: hypothetical protein HKN72_09705 [Gemmatimonadetes bacterium]|nr:hypothetical protein [Gemmatimonadota bacterium]
MRERALVFPLIGLVLLVTASRLDIATDEQPFLTADRCIACHKGVTTSTGTDVSIGLDWRASMMANSARDPYWHAAVRREVMDHPNEAAAIENECSRCHMPMANEVEKRSGRTMSVFANVPHAADPSPTAPLAVDGVSCAACHQIQQEGLGDEQSFVGGFQIASEGPPAGRSIFGPFEPDEGGVGIMRSATGYRPVEGRHVQTSELCATCHTLLTHAIGADGAEGEEFPEQVPYQEWQASAYAREEQSCQSCHMPTVDEHVPVTSVLGQPREGVSRHVFRGGNFFMLEMLGRYRDELGVTALPQELQLAVARTKEHLRTSTALIEIVPQNIDAGTLAFDVGVRNLAGHKFPTAYPSRRAWLHVVVRDAQGETVFESGGFRADGGIVGNDNDRDATSYEPHYERIDSPEQVQIYEAIMVDGENAVTTGLLQAERWIKDNRLTPRGFEPGTAEARIAVRGQAATDPTFESGVDRVRYEVAVSGEAPYSVSAALWFQPIAYRWALNLAEYEAFETDRFVRYYREMSSASAMPLVRAEIQVR